MGLYEFMFGGGEKVEDDLEETQKGMGYGELILDNVIGLDNEYDSFGEKLGRTINEDEIGFMKQAGQGIYEGAKEFVKAPIETTKEAVREVATSTKDLFTKDLDERLQEMYGVDMTSATGEQITAAREGVMSDALGASALIPAAGVGIKGVKVIANAMPDLDTAAEYFKNIPMPEYDPNTLGMNLGNIKFNKALENGVGLRNYTLDDLSRLDAEVGDYSNIKSGRGVDGDAKLGVVPENGTVVALRPNLNTSIPNNPLNIPDNPKTGKKGETKLTTIHDGTNEKKVEGSVLGYVPYAVAENVSFVVNQNSRRQIASRIHGLDVADAKNKFPSMSVVGTFNGNRNLLEEGVELVELGVNPAVNHLFVDMSTGQAVKGADAAMTIGDRVLAVGVKYYNREDAPKPQPASDGTELPNTVVYKYENAAEELETSTVPATVAEQTENMLDTSKVVPGGNPEFGPTGRISTRMPLQAPLKDEIPAEEFYSGELTIGRDVMDEAGTTEKNMEYLASNREQSDDVVKSKGTERPLFTSKTPNPYEDIGDVPYFPGFKALEGMSTEDRVKFVSAMQKENLEWVMDKLPQGFQDRAKLWYTGANRFSEELSSKYGVPRQSMSGVLAALSPQKDWFQNASLAERVADAAINNRNFPWSSEMSAVVNKYPTFKTGGRGKNAAIWESIQGKKYSELETTKQKAMWIRAYDEAHNPKTYRALTPEGDLGEIILAGNSPKDIAWGGFNTIEKAVDALESGGDFKILSDTMGGQHKVRNFFNNIEVPFSDMGDVTIDTHAIAAALMRPLGGDDRLVAQGLGAIGGQNKSLGAKGNYGFIADDYRDVADNRGLLPREVQSITWEGIRSLFNNKSDAVKRKVNTIWSQVDKGNLTQQQALDLIEAEMGGFGATNQVLTPRTNRSIAAGSSTMFAAGGLALLDDDIEEEGFATPQ